MIPRISQLQNLFVCLFLKKCSGEDAEQAAQET